MRCRCCGQEVLDEIAQNVRLGPMERDMLDTIRRAGPAGIEATRIQTLQYANRSDGGPENLRRVISVRRNMLNRKLAPLGWHITGGRGAGTRYRLERIAP